MSKPPLFFIATLFALAFTLLDSSLEAASAEWDFNPSTSDWNNAANWIPDTVPNGPADTATFGASDLALVSLTENTEVAGIVFSNLAPSYTIAASPGATLTISGFGITNNSGNEAVFMAEVSSGADVGTIAFVNSASAGNVTLVGNGGLNGGSIQFADDSLGGTARVKVYFNGNLDISAHNASGLSIGSIEGTGKVFLGGNNLTVGSNDLSTLLSGTIQDGGIAGGTGGSLTKIGSGTLTLVGTAAFGGDLTVENGTLEITSGGSVSNRFGYAGIMPGSDATLVVDGPGSVWTNMYGAYIGYLGGTGTLMIQNGGSVSSGGGYIGNFDGGSGTVLVDGPGSIWTSSSSIYIGDQDASGTLTITNSGTVSSSSCFIGYEGFGTAEVDGVGSTWTNDGPLYVGGGGTGMLTIRNGGTVSDAEGFIGRFISFIGASVVVVDGIGSTWTNSVRLEVGGSAGMLVIQNGGAVSSADGVIGLGPDSNGTVLVNGSGSIWNSGSIEVGERGMLTIENGGTISSDSSSINGIALVDGSGSTWQSALSVGFSATGVLTIQNGGSVSGGGGDIGTFDGGNGIVNVDGMGSTWVNTFGVTVGFLSSGTLNITNGGVVSDADGEIAARPDSSGTVNVDGAGSAWTNSSNLLVGGGEFGHGGTGLLQIVNGGTVSAAATTIFGDGTVINDATLISPVVSLLPGGILGGSGTVLGSVTNAGVVSPGDSPGTLTLTGNYTQAGTGILQIEIAGLTAGAHDLLAIGGSAALAGTLHLVQLNTFMPRSGDTITFLTASDGVGGTFDTLDGAFSNETLLRAEVVYQPNDVLIQFVQESFANLPGLTPNQEAVADILDRVVDDPNAAALVEFLDGQSLASLPADYDRIAPEELTAIFEIGISTANVQGYNVENRLEEIRNGASGFSSRLSITDSKGARELSPNSSKDGGSDSEKSVIDRALAPSSPENRWGFFVSGTGQFVNLSGDFNAHGYDFQTGGMTFGLDYRLSEHCALGLTAGYAHTSAQLVDAGSIAVNNGKLGLYGTWFSDGAYLNGLAEGGYNSYQTQRSALLGFAKGDTVGGEFSALFSGGYDLKCGNWTIGPTVAVRYTLVGFRGFTESGSLAPLALTSQDADALSTLLGGQLSYHWQKNSVIVRPEFRAGWKHDLLDQALAIDSSLDGVTGSSFTVHGPGRGRNSAVLSAGLNVQWSPRVQASVNYQAEVGRMNYVQQSITGGVNVSF